MQAFIATHTETLFLVSFGLIIILFILLISAFRQIRALDRLKRRLDRLVMVDEPVPLGDLLKHFNDNVSTLSMEQERIQEEFDHIKHSFETTIVHTGLVQYDAFDDSGLHLSYSLCLLNESNTGVIITGLHGGEKALTYGKKITLGESDSPLSPEERQALSMAKNREQPTTRKVEIERTREE